MAEEAGGGSRVGVGEGEGGGDAGQQLLLPLRGQSRQHPLRLLLCQPAHVRRWQAVLQPRQHLHTHPVLNPLQCWLCIDGAIARLLQLVACQLSSTIQQIPKESSRQTV